MANLAHVTRTAAPRERVGVDRRAIIVDAALKVITDQGVAALTHRKVAAEAKVPLGSTTYYFETLDDILVAAFDLAMERDTAMLQAWADALPDDVDLPQALTDLVVRLTRTEIRTMCANLDLVLAAARRPQLQERAHRWGGFLTKSLSPHLPPDAAAAASVVYDGTVLRQIMTGSIGGPDEVLTSFRRACAAATLGGSTT